MTTFLKVDGLQSKIRISDWLMKLILKLALEKLEKVNLKKVINLFPRIIFGKWQLKRKGLLNTESWIQFLNGLYTAHFRKYILTMIQGNVFWALNDYLLIFFLYKWLWTATHLDNIIAYQGKFYMLPDTFKFCQLRQKQKKRLRSDFG